MTEILKPLILSFARLLQFDDATATPADGAGAPETFVLPENITREGDDALDDEALTALRDEAVAAFDLLYDNGGSTAALNDLAEAIEALRTEVTAREAADASDQADRDALAARVRGEAPAAEDEETPADGDEETPAEGEAAPAPTAEAPAAAEGDPAPAAAEATPAEVAASAAPTPRRRITVPLGQIRANAPTPEVPTGNPAIVITAAADIPGFVSGNVMPDQRSIALAMHAKARHLGEGGSAPIASISRPTEHWIPEGASYEAQEEILAAAMAMPGDGTANGLQAAGGWCAPSQTFYGLFSIEGSDGILDIPTVGIERGGITSPQNGGPSLADVFGDPNIWLWTEQDDIDAAGNPHVDPDDDRTKPCARIPCPTFTDTRLQAHGICLTHGNLADKAYPEMTRRFVDLTMATHLHTMNMRHIATIAALCTDVTIAALQPGVYSPLMLAIELQVLDYRDKYRMPQGAVLECVLPNWIKGMIRADLSYRAIDGALGVTDAQINEWFAIRGVRVQFVYDWQPLQTGASGQDGFREAYPTAVHALLYAAGTYVKGLGGNIDLGVVRDSTLNATNDHTAAWSEEFDLIRQMGHEGRELILTGILPDGQVGPQTIAQAA